jgi:hypothetical protein
MSGARSIVGVPPVVADATADRLREEFDRVGAVIVRGVLSEAEVRVLRDSIHEAFVPLDQRAGSGLVRDLPATMALRIRAVRRAIVQPQVVAALAAILEPHYSIAPDLNIHRNKFTTRPDWRPANLFGLLGPGWHYDAGNEGPKPYFFAPDYRTVKCGLFLQDNTPASGGGIDIAPGGHQWLVRSGVKLLDYYAQHAWHKFRILTAAESLDIKAGDFVAFDSWLPHRSSCPKPFLNGLSEEEKRAGCARLPAERAKLVIYFNASRRRYAHTYVEHCLGRGVAELRIARDGGTQDLFFADFPGLRYPEDYPSDFVDSLQRHGIEMAQIRGPNLEQARELRRRALESGRFNNYMEDAG